MDIYKATIISTVDLSEEGRIMVFCDEISDDYFEVTYVSPYYSDFQGGMIAIPAKGADILISKAVNSDDWYYLGSVVDRKRSYTPPKSGLLSRPDVGEISPHLSQVTPVMPEEGIYSSRNAPSKVILKSPLGNCLTLSDQNNKEFNNIRAELRTPSGKRLMMHDGNEVGAVMLQNEELDGIKIASKMSKHLPTRSIQIESSGDQAFRTKKGSMDLNITDGQDISIYNKSNGTMSLSMMKHQTGNVNIKSKWRDINITCNNKVGGRIFVHAGEKIQLEATTGEVIIHAARKVTIASTEGIDMISGGDIKMSAAKNIDIVAGVGMSCGSLGPQGISMVSPAGMVSVDAQKIHLNSGLALPIVPILTLQLASSVYALTPANPMYVIQPNNYGDPIIPDTGT